MLKTVSTSFSAELFIEYLNKISSSGTSFSLLSAQTLKYWKIFDLKSNFRKVSIARGLTRESKTLEKPKVCLLKARCVETFITLQFLKNLEKLKF